MNHSLDQHELALLATQTDYVHMCVYGVFAAKLLNYVKAKDFCCSVSWKKSKIYVY